MSDRFVLAIMASAQSAILFHQREDDEFILSLLLL
jgi:hypothetical protein